MNATLEDRLSESLTQHAATLRPSSGVDRNSLGRAVHKRGHKRQRRTRSLTVLAVGLSLALSGIGIGAYVNQQKSKSVVADSTNDLRLLPSWTPQGSTVSISQGPYPFNSPNSLTVWGTGPDKSVSVSAYSAPGIGGRTLEQALQQLESERASVRPEPGFIGLDWTANGLQINLFSSGNSQIKLREIAMSLSIDPETLKVTVPSFGLPLKFQGTQEMVQPSGLWSMSLRGSDISVNARIPNTLQTELFGDPFGVPAGFKTVEVRGNKAKVFAIGSPSGVAAQQIVQWSEGDWVVRVTGSKADDVLRVAQGLSPATQVSWNALVERRPQAILREADPVSQTVSVEGINIEVQLLAKDDSCFSAVLKLSGTNDETICVPINKGNVMWSGLRSSGGKRFAISFVSDRVDALTVASPDQAKPTQTVGSVVSNAAWAEGVVIKTGPSSWTWVGVSIQEIIGQSPVSLDLFAADQTGEPESTSSDLPVVGTSEPTDVDSAETDYQLRFIERVSID